MKAAIQNFQEAIQDIKNTSTDVILEKAKGAYNYVCWNRNMLAHRQCKGSYSKNIAHLKNGNSKFVDFILHQDDSVTLITSDKYYLKFYNRSQ